MSKFSKPVPLPATQSTSAGRLQLTPGGTANADQVVDPSRGGITLSGRALHNTPEIAARSPITQSNGELRDVSVKCLAPCWRPRSLLDRHGLAQAMRRSSSARETGVAPHNEKQTRDFVAYDALPSKQEARTDQEAPADTHALGEEVNALGATRFEELSESGSALLKNAI